jgi:hypothetical protein
MGDEVVRIPLQEVTDLVKPGEALPFRVLDAQGRLLLNEGHVIRGEAQMEALIERGAWAESDRVAEVRAARGIAPPGTVHAPAVRAANLFDRWEQSVWTLDTLLRRLGRGEAGAAELAQAAQAHAALVDRDPDVALFMALRQDGVRFALYALTHALHTGTLLLLTARALGWPAPQVASGVGAALTMNAAMVELQATMAEQREPPSQKQMALIRSHPVRGTALLRAAGVDDAEWLAAVEQHHEQPGGSGYPAGLAAPAPLPHLLRACDVFMAKITPRAFRAALPPQAAARQLFQQEKGSALAGTLIKSIGVYPPGDLVALKSGEVGVVTRRAAAGRGVLVATLTDARGRPVPETHQRDTADAAFAIAGPLGDRSAFPRVLPERVFGVLPA